jgi:UDP-2-acetamido-2-deoxy-ribo-hexuluronate aminotransferase
MPKTKNQKSKTTIDFAKLQYQYQLYKTEIDEAIHAVLDKSNYIMGEEVRELEENLQTFTGAKHAISCSSGTDALLLAMMALDIQPGDEIITTPFTFIATAETIAFLGAVPVFVDIDEKTYNIDPTKIEAAITDKTKAIMPVSLYGQPADMDAIQSVIDKAEGRRQKAEEEKQKNDPLSLSLPTSSSKIYIIIDGAQSFGATYKGKTDSNLGDISTTSFFPAKPLGCFGDGGAVFTNNDALAEKMKSLRVHGQSKRYHHQYIGIGGRMDTLQCAIVNVKLKYYTEDLKKRQEVASKYNKLLKTSNQQPKTNNQKLITQFVTNDCTSAWAQYSIRLKTNNQKPETRDQFQARLKSLGIPTAVHYPMPLHLQECFSYLGQGEGDFPICEQVSNEIISLPMNPYLSDEEISYISEKVLKCLH